MSRPAKKPFCKVCFDAKQPESVYSSHWVRSLPNFYGIVTVTCPTLLNNLCSHCGETGHTVSFCRVLKKSLRAEKAAIYKKTVDNNSNTNNKSTLMTKKNAFSGLSYGTSSEEDEPQSCEADAKDQPPDLIDLSSTEEETHQEKPQPREMQKKQCVNWADRVDSDSDDN